MEIKLVAKTGGEKFDTAHQTNLIYYVGKQYGLGVRDRSDPRNKYLWFTDSTGKKHEVEERYLIELQTFPQTGSKPKAVLWCDYRDAPFSASYQVDYMGKKLVHRVYAMDEDRGYTKLLRWAALALKLDFKTVISYFQKHPEKIEAVQ